MRLFARLLMMIPQPFLRTFYGSPSIIHSHRVIDQTFVGCWVDRRRDLFIMSKPHLDPSKFADAMDSMRDIVTADPEVITTRMPVGFHPEIIEPLDRSSVIMSGVDEKTRERSLRIFDGRWTHITDLDGRSVQAASLRAASPHTVFMTDYSGVITVIDTHQKKAATVMRTNTTTLDACPLAGGGILTTGGIGGVLTVNLTSGRIDRACVNNNDAITGVSAVDDDEIAVLSRDDRICVIQDGNRLTWCGCDMPLDQPFMSTKVFHVARIRDSPALLLRLRERWRTSATMAIMVVSQRGEWAVRDGVITSFGNSMIEAWDLHQEFFRWMNRKQVHTMIAPTIKSTECVWTFGSDNTDFTTTVDEYVRSYHAMADWMKS